MILLRNFFLPLSILVGTIIGAGIFSLPFVMAQSGIILGLFFLIIITLAATIMHLMYADIILRTPDHHNRFPGYAKTYLGNKAGILANVIIFSTLLLTLTAYLALSVSFTNLLFPTMPQFYKVFVFWLLGSAAVFLNIKRAAEFEICTTTLTLLVIAAVFGIGFVAHPAVSLDNHIFDFKNALTPFGPILFSIMGLTAIPPILVYYREEKLSVPLVKKIITWGTFLPALFYLLFVLGIWGLSKNITIDSVSGLIETSPRYILILFGLFGFVSLWDSYATLGTDVKKNLEYEKYKMSPITIGVLVIFLPLALYLIGFSNFLALISIIGGILFSLRAIITIFIWKKAVQIPAENFVFKKSNPKIVWFLIILFISGIIYQLVKFI